MNEPIGITGGCGYIGGLLVRRLSALRSRVIVVDNHTGPVRACAGFLGDDHPSVDIRNGDLERILRPCGLIVHLAAVSGIERVAKDRGAALATNVDSTRRIATLAKEIGIPVLFASSFAVVGPTNGLTVTERTEPRPVSPYAEQKLLGETILRETLGRGGPGGAILRMTNVFGRYLANGQEAGLPRWVAKGTLVDKFYDLAGSGMNLPVYGTGEQVRNYLYIGDAVELWLRAIRKAERKDGISTVPTYILAGPQNLSVNAVAKVVLEATESTSNLFPTGNPRVGEVAETSLSIDDSFTTGVLGTEAKTTVREYLSGLSGPR
ncbi:MAG TPA: NAD(P)-dependent oxidoreductase [Thermoplasmata archaeon]|jgi:UDP-glucose 4-epimerase